MVSGFLSKEGGRRCFILASDKNKKEQKNLRIGNVRNRTITKQRTLKHEIIKRDRNPPIPNHKPWPFELVQANMCSLRGPLRWLTEQKKPNFAINTDRVFCFVLSCFCLFVCLFVLQQYSRRFNVRWNIFWEQKTLQASNVHENCMVISCCYIEWMESW